MLERTVRASARLHSAVAGELVLAAPLRAIEAELVPTFLARKLPSQPGTPVGGGVDVPGLLFGSDGTDGLLQVATGLALEFNAETGGATVSLIGPFGPAPDLIDESDPVHFFFGYRTDAGWRIERQRRETALTVRAMGPGDLDDIWPSRSALTYEAQS